MTDNERLSQARVLIAEALDILTALGHMEGGNVETPNRARPTPKSRRKARQDPIADLAAMSPRDDRMIGESGIVDATHPDIEREAASSDEELEARVTMRKLRESGVIETAPVEPRPEITVETDDDLIG